MILALGAPLLQAMLPARPGAGQGAGAQGTPRLGLGRYGQGRTLAAAGATSLRTRAKALREELKARPPADIAFPRIARPGAPPAGSGAAAPLAAAGAAVVQGFRLPPAARSVAEGAKPAVPARRRASLDDGPAATAAGTGAEMAAIPRLKLGDLPETAGAGLPTFRARVSRPLAVNAEGLLDEAPHSTPVELLNSTGQLLSLALPAAGGGQGALVSAGNGATLTELLPVLEEAYEMRAGELIQVRTGALAETVSYDLNHADGSAYARLELTLE